MATDGVLDYGWLAGWIDAAAEVVPTADSHRITVVFPTREVLDLVRRNFGGSARKIRHHGEDAYKLVIDGSGAQRMLGTLEPFLVVKGKG